MAVEFSRQPFQQLRMTRSAAVEAEVAGSLDEARAEVVVPDSIRHDSGEERVVGVRDPVRQSNATMRFDGVGLEAEARVEALDGGQSCGCDLIAERRDAATLMDLHRWQLRGDGRVKFDRPVLAEVGMFELQVAEFGLA